MRRKIKDPVFLPLCDAAADGNMEEFESLLANGVDIDARDYNNITALYYAVIYNRLEMAKMLLDMGADIEIRDGYGNTPLLQCKPWQVDMIKLLLSYGADVNAENNCGWTPKKLSKIAVGYPQLDEFKD